MAVRSYRELIAWQKAMDLVESVYKITSQFPKEELYSLSSQLKRAAVPVASNIAEGQGRKSTREFLRHLSIAYGSMVETETQLIIGQRLQFMTEPQLNALLEQTAEVGRLKNLCLTLLMTDWPPETFRFFLNGRRLLAKVL